MSRLVQMLLIALRKADHYPIPALLHLAVPPRAEVLAVRQGEVFLPFVVYDILVRHVLRRLAVVNTLHRHFRPRMPAFQLPDQLLRVHRTRPLFRKLMLAADFQRFP